MAYNSNQSRTCATTESPKIAPDLIFWFALSVQNVEEFEPTYRRNSWSFPCPDSDSKRRGEIAFSATKDVVFHIIQCRDARRGDGPSIWHFEFYVRLSSIDEYPTPESTYHLNPSRRSPPRYQFLPEATLYACPIFSVRSAYAQPSCQERLRFLCC